MAIKKIPCGGFMYDDETIIFENGVMKAIGGGSGGGAMVVNFVIQVSGEELIVSADKTPAEVIAAALIGSVMGTMISPDLGATEITPLGGVAFSDISSPAFYLMSVKNGMHYLISTENGDWVATLA